MKIKNRIIFSILFACLSIPSIIAKDGDDSKDDKPIILVIVDSKPLSRPQAPSNQEISCTLREGCLFFNFRYPEGVCSLEVTDFESGDINTYTFDSEGEAAVLVGELNNAHLLITTAFGHSYEGEIQ